MTKGSSGGSSGQVGKYELAMASCFPPWGKQKARDQAAKKKETG